MAEAQLCKVESAHKAIDRADRIVRPDIVLNPWRKETALFPALAGLECMIRHKPNRTSTPENADILAQSRRANHFVFSEMACPAPFAKIFLFRPEANQFTDSRRPAPTEGRAHVTNAGRDAVDAGSALDETCC